MSGRASPLFPEAAAAHKVPGTVTLPHDYTLKAVITIVCMIVVTSQTITQMLRTEATERTQESLDVVTKPTQAQLSLIDWI